jgi:hypothetical protein
MQMVINFNGFDFEILYFEIGQNIEFREFGIFAFYNNKLDKFYDFQISTNLFNEDFDGKIKKNHDATNIAIIRFSKDIAKFVTPKELIEHLQNTI